MNNFIEKTLNQMEGYQLDKIWCSSVLAGIMIGLAGIVNLSMDNKIVGAFLFSFGLITIISQRLSLYTGKIGMINLSMEWFLIPFYIIGNFLGTNIVAWSMRCTRFGNTLNQVAQAIVQNKLSDSWISILFLAVGCGIMMYLAVNGFSKTNNWLLVILPVMIFILSGFEHSIANMFYFAMAGEYNLKSFGYIIIMLIGNAIGSLVFKKVKSI